VNPSHCERTGCWWLWISTPAASLASGFRAESLMVWRFVACSRMRFEVRRCRNISARIMTHCIGFINGRRTCGFWGITEIKTVAYVPLSHPFIERLIGTFVMDDKTAVLL